ncbi:MAG TPA: hypothetical protein PK644_10310, partial [bacterium]|nr:hypothetical protein [bacterium]
TFYHAGGKVVWDLTCLNEAAVPARVTTWQELDRPVSPYFLWEAIGPLKFSDQTFVVLSLNSLSGTENCRWRISGKEYSGSSLKVRVPPEKKLPVSLTVVDHQGQPLTLEKQLLLPQEKPEEIKVEMKDIPRPSFAYPREQVLISHQLSSMTAVPLPLEITADGKQEEVLLLPREENSRMLHHCLSLPGERKPFSVQVCLAGLKLLERKFLFLPLTEAAGVTCQG